MVTINNINRAFDNAITNISIKCGRNGSRNSSGVIYGQGEAPRFQYNDGKLDTDELNEIADTMAKRWGLEVSIDEKGKREVSKTKFTLWDDKNKTIIRLNKIVKHQNWIDFTNNGKGSYNLDDVLRYYTEMSDISKQRCGGLIFETNGGASYNGLYDKKMDIINPIVIRNSVYGMGRGTNVPSEFHMKQVMAHEFGHASERILTLGDAHVIRKSAVSNTRFSSLGLNSAELRRYELLLLNKTLAPGKTSAISYSQEWIDAMAKNNVRFASAYSSSNHGYGIDGNSEDFAETMSAVAYRNSNDKSNFRIMYSDGTTVDWDTFVRDHEATYNLCCDFVDGKITHNDLHDPASLKHEQFTD